MKKALILTVFFTIAATAFSQNKRISIIPQPAVLREGMGTFTIDANTAIVVGSNDPEAMKVAAMLNIELKKAAGFSLNIENAPRKKSIQFLLSPEEPLGNEGYRLAVTPEMISIFAPKPAGLFYGLQTLLQLMPKEIESRMAKTPKTLIDYKQKLALKKYGRDLSNILNTRVKFEEENWIR